ncbi:MAG: hypothetical protein KDB53_04975 [Planctomycetes bacterium]|nr:hypothetical protein [Planctomycetota bacterium]
MLTRSAARYLISDAGRERALEVAADPRRSDQVLRSLRDELPADLAAALIDQMRGRASLARRHPRASELFTTTRAAAQATSAVVAAWRARRFAGVASVADLGCGLGADSMALAREAPTIAVDRDPALLILTRANLAQVDRPSLCLRADLPQTMPLVDWIFADPDRRSGSGRETDPELASPPLSALLAAAGAAQGIGVKLSPMIEVSRIEAWGELEFVSVRRELREIVLWTRGLASGARRVSLPELGYSFESVSAVAPAPRAPGAILFDPDPALIRSGLLGRVAVDTGLAPLDATVAYLSGPPIAPHPLLRPFELLAICGPSARQVQIEVNRLGLGLLSASRRGFAVAPDAFLKRLRPGGGEPGHLFLTRIQGRPTILVTRAVSLG